MLVSLGRWPPKK